MTTQALTTDANTTGAGAARVLGLSCGQPRGSAEILLKEALQAAAAAGADVQLVRLEELRIPSGPDPSEPDDAWWFWERLVECAGLIVSTPIISRSVTGRLKLLGDRLLGPNADAAIIEQLLEVRRAGHEPTVPFRLDERVLRPRVAGFLAVGGALTSQWRALALPLLHTLTFSMSTAVVDQALFGGAGTPRSIVLDADALTRAKLLGERVAGQLGRGLDDAEYLGDAGLCPMCHLDVVVLRGTDVECATCGARGRLAGADGAVSWTDLTTSVIGMADRQAHSVEIQETAARHAGQRAEIERRASAYDAFDPVVRPAADEPVSTRS
ncbi:NAD(P)H-dependent oxidoreductase [uncultured Jatrophihabitans sp.]|uniref:NAD(P)H-dependent oxidoreductase n=1 Tax=uncultured Jatrophihabitans sp. TaxID=1610747 RepID=UPI0035CBBB88